MANKSQSISAVCCVLLELSILYLLHKASRLTGDPGNLSLAKIKVSDEIKDKKDLEKIILCDVQTEIYPDLEKSLLDLLHNSGYPGVKFEKKIDFEKLYNQKFN